MDETSLLGFASISLIPLAGCGSSGEVVAASEVDVIGAGGLLAYGKLHALSD